jgi:hypothetical protein
MLFAALALAVDLHSHVCSTLHAVELSYTSMQACPCTGELFQLSGLLMRVETLNISNKGRSVPLVSPLVPALCFLIAIRPSDCL